MKHYLCIDYGTKHTGVAYAVTPLAEPLETIPTKDLIPYLKQVAKEHEIDAVVVGVSEGEMAQEIKEYAHQLHFKLELPLIFHDETLSSQETRKKLARAGVKRSKREQKIDHYVAAAILQDYLDSQG